MRGKFRRRCRDARDTRSRCRRRPISPALARLAVARGGPRDLAAIRDGALAAAELARALGSLKDTPTEIADARQACRRPDGMLAADSPGAGGRMPAFKRDGVSCARAMTHAGRDARLRDASRRVIAELQARYA